MSAFLQKKLALIVGIILIICFTLLFSVRCGCRLLLRRGGCSRTNFYDNIGQIDMEGRLSYGPIDVVYTWVNGSDPKWQATKEFYRRGQQRRRLLWNADDDQQWISQEYADIDDYYLDQRYAEDYFGEDEEEEDNYQEEDIDDEDSDQHAIEDTYLFKNETIIPTPIPTIIPTSIPTADQSASANRYRDSEELRYSLRSLEAYAPWVRHIYLVTDNQIPWWLNMDEKKITVVPHNAIFQDTSKLPVFSSPAIESQLHNVPGVSRQFIYFNDDVMLGAPTFPEDFVSLSGAQRIYLAWEAPKCNPGCNDNWIGDGSCDEACNVSSCDFDFPDCLPTDHPDRISYQEKENNHKKKSSSSSKYNKQARKAPVQSRAAQSAAAKIKHDKFAKVQKNLNNKKCAFACPRAWLGDSSCDTKCNVASCFWDAGDCRPIQADAPANTTIFDIPIGEHGIVVNLTGLPYTNFVDANLQEEGLDSEIIVYDLLLLRQAQVLIVYIDAAKAKQILTSRQRAEQIKNRFVTNSTNNKDIKNNQSSSSSIYFKNWTASVLVVPDEYINDDAKHVLNGINVSFTFRLYDPKEILKKNNHVYDTRRSTAVVNTANCIDPKFQAIPHQKLDLSLGDEWSLSLDLNLSSLFVIDDWLIVQTGSVTVHRGDKHIKASPIASYVLDPVPLRDVLLDRRQSILDISLIKPTKISNASILIKRWRQALTKKNSSRKPFLWTSGAIFLVPKNITNTNLSQSDLVREHAIACASFAIEAYEDWHLFDDDDMLLTTTSKSNNGRRRLLLDTYGESLARVNRMYSRTFGKPDYGQTRRVPAHMPHMINVDILKEMQKQFPEEWQQTASNRFRSGKDMQFAFAYFHYIISRAKQYKPDFDVIWINEIDADGDGFLNGNEIITLASMAKGKEADDIYIDDIYNCVATKFSWSRWFQTRRWVFWFLPTFVFYNDKAKYSQQQQQISARAARWDRSTGYVATLESTKQCQRVVDGIVSFAKKREERRAKSYVLESNLNEVAFEMLDDDYNHTRTQLDSIRARRVKFICINDNINHMTPELFALLQDFFRAYYPKRSRFELPPGVRNTHLRLEDFLRDRFRRRFLLAALVSILGAALLVSLFLYMRNSSLATPGMSEYSALSNEGADSSAVLRPKAE